jgi:hypothetical protein
LELSLNGLGEMGVVDDGIDRLLGRELNKMTGSESKLTTAGLNGG